MKYLLLFIPLVFTIQSVKAQINIELLHQLVNHSKDEYEKQIKARNLQSLSTANQQIIDQQTSKFKERYQEITDRFNTLGEAMMLISTSLESASLIEDIINQHKRIAKYVISEPAHLTLAFNAEKNLLSKTTQLSRYVLGLMLSMGDLNQMQQSDRRILYGHVINELRAISSASRTLANSLQRSQMLKKINASNSFSSFIDQDKKITESILSQIKNLKK